MGAINAYSGDEFPGAEATLDTDLGAGDCALFDTFEELVTELQGNSDKATTIRFGRAYTIASVAFIAGVCQI